MLPLAQDLVHSVVDRYSNIASYTDRGVVHTPTGVTSIPHELKFRTTFERGSLFKFEFLDPVPHQDLNPNYVYSAIYFDYNETHFIELEQSGSPEVKKYEHFKEAISDSTGISTGAAQTISRLLLPEITTGFALSNILYSNTTKVFQQNGDNTYEVEGKGPMNLDVLLWIQETTYLLLKHGIKKKGASNWVEEVRLSIGVNNKINNENFSIKTAIEQAASTIEIAGSW